MNVARESVKMVVAQTHRVVLIVFVRKDSTYRQMETIVRIMMSVVKLECVPMGFVLIWMEVLSVNVRLGINYHLRDMPVLVSASNQSTVG